MIQKKYIKRYDLGQIVAYNYVIFVIYTKTEA